MRRIGWNVLPPHRLRAQHLARVCGMDPVIGQLLMNRGIEDAAHAERFFSPRLESLGDPCQLPAMASAVARLRHAVKSREPVMVFGDSDVDGISASAIVSDLLASFDADVTVRISNRLEDGYGFPAALHRDVVRSGAKVVILVDCGTNQPDEVRALAQQGIDTIILDHHVPAARVAQPLALVNPYLGDGYGREFCSAGLALKLVQAMWPDSWDRVASALDLAVMGTLADYATLVGENRVIVSLGLERLVHTQRPGLRRLCEAVRLTTPTPEQFLQKLSPRLNAAGRLGDALPVWRLLVTSSDAEAQALVDVLGGAHQETKRLHRRMLSEAYEQANRLHLKDHYVMVIARPGWHPGLMGPIAAQLVDRYARPAIAIAMDGDVGVGSGRSLGVFNLFEALRACEGTLLRYGGHPRACGLTLEPGNLERFREQINRHAHVTWDRGRLGRELTIDAELSLEDLTPAVIEGAQRFAPYGPGNQRPMILLRNVTLSVDDNDQAWLTDGRTRVKVWGRRLDLQSTESYDVVVSLRRVSDTAAVSLCEASLSDAPQVSGRATGVY